MNEVDLDSRSADLLGDLQMVCSVSLIRSFVFRRRTTESESTLGSGSLSGSNMSLSSVTSLEQLQLSSDDSHVNGNSW